MMKARACKVGRYSGICGRCAGKYTEFLIAEVKLKIEASELAPGEYGFGFVQDGNLMVMDVGANDLLRVPANLTITCGALCPSRSCRKGKPTDYCGKEVGFSWAGIRA